MKIYIDPAELAEKLGRMKQSIEEDVRTGVERLANETNEMITALFHQELKSSLNIYKKAYEFKQEGANLWVISVGKDALWIENGHAEDYNMKESLLKDAKTSASTGHKYKIIPFDHASPETKPQDLNQFGKDIRKQVQDALKKNGVKFSEIAKNQDGSPRVGKIAAYDFGGELPGKGNTPVMQGVSIYQTPDAKSPGGIRRDILTFRTVTDAPDGKWVRKAFDGKKFLERGEKWALDTWEKEIVPAIMEKWKK